MSGLNHPSGMVGMSGSVGIGVGVGDVIGRTRHVSRYDPSPMLPRLPAPAEVDHATPTGAEAHTPLASTKAAQPASQGLKHWLFAQGSLTARLRQHGTVTVEVLAQGQMPLFAQERQALGCRAIHQGAHVREVLLRLDGKVAVWARSVTPLSAVKGPWAAIEGLGTRPLAELLFTQRTVLRGPLQACHLVPHCPLQQRMARAWQAHDADSALPRWARHSIFWHREQPLQVMEAFAPWVASLPRERR